MNLLLSLSIICRQLTTVWLFYLRHFLIMRRFTWELPDFEGCGNIAILAPGESVLTSIPATPLTSFDKTIAVNTFIFHDVVADVCFLELSPIYKNSELLVERVKAKNLSRIYLPSHSLGYSPEHNELLLKIADKIRFYNICSLSVKSPKHLGIAFKCFYFLKRIRLIPVQTMLSPGASISRMLILLSEAQVGRVALFGVDGSTRYFFQGSDGPGASYDTGQAGPRHATADEGQKAVTVQMVIDFLNEQRDGKSDWITRT